MKRVVHLTVLVLVVFAPMVVARPSPSLAGGEERVMVEFAPGRGPAVRAALQRAGGSIHHQFDDLSIIAVTLPAAAVAGIQRNPNVVAITEDPPRYLQADTTPWGVTTVQAPQVWAEGITGSGVTVCVIDSGLYTEHEDLAGVNVTGYGSDWSRDFCGHGTHVAGTIAAAHDSLGVDGISPNVSLYIVKVFGDDCSWTYSSDLIAASKLCADAGADIISMSLGGSRKSTLERRQFDRLYSQGILSIAAAGNAGDTSYSYPASYDSVVSVAAIDAARVVADFSQQNNQVEVAAPGVAVLSTVPYVTVDTLTVGGITYDAAHIEYAAYGTASGALANSGLCTTTGAWSGKVVLCQRGDISFYDKVMNVQASGGAAAIIYNDEPGNFLGTLGDGASSAIVAISISKEDGELLAGSEIGANADVVSTILHNASDYEAWDGTSMATPHVSAVAALLWSSNPGLSNAEIRGAMTATALDLGVSGRDNAYGYGLVQAYNALQYLGGGTPADEPPTVQITAPANGATVQDTFTVAADASDDNGVTQVAFFAGGGSIGVDVDGSDGWSVSWDTTTSVDGGTTVSATATDTTGQTASHSVNVTVSNGSAATVIYVSDITVTGKAAGPNRSATAAVTIGDTAGNPVAGASVSGAWSGGYSALASGLTAADGTVTFTTPRVRNATSFTFTVTGVDKDGATYNAGLNAETSDSVNF